MDGLVRLGHRQSVDLLKRLAEANFGATARTLGVYLRPTNAGIRLVDVRDGAGTPCGDLGLISSAEEATAAAALIEKAAEDEQKSAILDNEAALEARLIRHALANSLRLPGFPESVRFIHSQWRIQFPERTERSDLIAIDLHTRRLVVIELKLRQSFAGQLQALRYAAFFNDHVDLSMFFEDVSQAMGALYDCPELCDIRVKGVSAPLFAWPEGPSINLKEIHSQELFGQPIDTMRLGRQYSADAPFTKRMRFHQSWWRLNMLRHEHCGFGPGPTGPRRYGNMLTDEVWPDNFIHHHAIEALTASTLKGSSLDRCRRNMLSSQPMCFNFFGPLKFDLGLATRIFRRLFPDRVQEVTDVRIEWPGKRKNSYLEDGTSLDAVVAYNDVAGTRHFLGIETKLTEPFSPDDYPLIHSPRYEEIMNTRPIWSADPPELLTEPRWNQLWRNHMLVEAVAKEGEPFGSFGRLMVIRHPEDLDCAEASRAYRAFLQESDRTFVDMPLDLLVSHVRAAMKTDEERGWLETFNRRYVDLVDSELAWFAHVHWVPNLPLTDRKEA